MTVKRAFAEITEGQVHYWHGGPSLSDQVPLVYLHPGPGTARHQVPLLNVMSGSIPVIAPDIMGMGDSAPAQPDAPDLDYFADAIFRFLDSIGVKRFFLAGSSLGGRTAVAMALQQPDRIAGLMLNRILMASDEQDLDEKKAKHAPEVRPDVSGSYIWFVWSRMRDLVFYFPWFKQDAAHLRKVDLPPPEVMHISFIEHIKMCATAHKAFTAYWNYPIAEKLRSLNVPVLCRAETAAFVKGAKTWAPGFEGEPLTAKPEQLALHIAPMLAFMRELKS